MPQIFYTFFTHNPLRDHIIESLSIQKRGLHETYTFLQYKSFLDRVRKIYLRYGTLPIQIIQKWKTEAIPGYIIYVSNTEMRNKKYNDTDSYYKMKKVVSYDALTAMVKDGKIILTCAYDSEFTDFEVYRHTGLDVSGMKEYVTAAPRLSTIQNGMLINPFSPNVIVCKIGNVSISKNMPQYLCQLDQHIVGYELYQTNGKLNEKSLINVTKEIRAVCSVSGIFGTARVEDVSELSEAFMVTPASLLSRDLVELQNRMLKIVKQNKLILISNDKVKTFEIASNGKKMIISTFFDLLKSKSEGLPVYDFFKALVYATDVSGDMMFSDLDQVNITLIGYDNFALRVQTSIIEAQLNDSFMLCGDRNIAVIASKGAGKSSIVRLLKENVDLSDVLILDSDDYGRWLSWYLLHGTDSLVAIRPEELRDFESYLECYVDELLRLPVSNDDKISRFGDEYVHKLESDDCGIKIFLKHMQVVTNKTKVLFFAHTSYEVYALPSNFRIVKIDPLFNTRNVMKSRVDGRNSEIQLWLHDVYEMFQASRSSITWLEFLVILFSDSMSWS